MIGPRYILLITVLITFVSCNSKTRDCEQYRTGEFVYNKNDLDSAIFITRNDSMQLETDRDRTFLMKLKVKWISSCEYELTFVSREPDHPRERSKGSSRFMDKIRMIPTRTKIISTGKDYYVFEATKEGIDFVHSDTMWVNKTIGGFKAMRETFK